VENFFKNSFALGQLYKEQSVVWLGSSINNPLAFTEANNQLAGAGLTVWEVHYSQSTSLPQTVVYQVNPKPATTEFIKNTFGAVEASLPPPGIKIDPKKVDVIVILGQDASSTSANLETP
jgi:hypothetical protein